MCWSTPSTGTSGPGNRPSYFRAGEQALAEIGFTLDLPTYLDDMAQARGTWDQPRRAGVDEATIDRQRGRRDQLYQQFLRSEPLEIAGVVEALELLSRSARMAIVTTSKRVDFEAIHRGRPILDFMGFVLVREDYTHAKPHPEPYLTALARFGASKDETLIVEDAARGLRSAVAAGIDCAVVHHDFTAGHDLSAATHRIGSLIELASLVGGQA